MSERFDDMIRKHFERLESPVPDDMFSNIRNHPDVSDAMFDASLKSKLQSAESPVAAGLFDKVNAEADLINAPFDEAIIQKTNSYESPVPADMWSRIMQEKPRRRPVAWWWVAAGLITLLSVGIWYATRHSGGKGVTFDQPYVTDKNTVSTNNPAIPGNVSSAEKNVLGATADTSKAVTANKSNAADTNQHSFTKSLLSTQDKANLTAKEKSETGNFKPQESTSIFTKDLLAKKEKNRISGKENRNGIAPEKNWDLILNNNGPEKKEFEIDAFATLNSLRSAISRQLRDAAKLSPGQLLKAKPRSPVIPCPVNADDKRNTWYADIYTAAFLVKKNISDNGSEKNVENGFDSTLHRQVSYNAGISIIKNVGNNLLLKTGLQYNRINESFRLTRINERKLVTTISVRTVIIAPGDTVYIRDTSVTEHIGTIQRRKQNTYQQWDVPVIIGYEFGGEDIHLNANAGIIANIRSSYSGEMIADTSQQIIDAKNYHGKPVYKTNVGFSLYAGLSIVKPLGQRTSLLIEPYARIGLQNLTTNEAWFRQKNSSAGISIGLRYQLNSGGQRR